MLDHLIVHKVFISRELPSSAVRSSQPSNTNGDFVFNPKTQIENFCVLEKSLLSCFFPKIFSSLNSRVCSFRVVYPTGGITIQSLLLVYLNYRYITEIGFTERMFSSHLSDLGIMTNHILLTLDYIFHHICSKYLRT